ncbi:9801_t:CDS:2 [Cetraspora pellucida]|uniref:9801_t:CDS:1 n=1 Tax=Cetraspora pellucida TaxID=1433469 RepID=A0A9N9H0U2_9GLOM|nr:9801_t:CDS:2 [Cetraspora pellucida]
MGTLLIEDSKDKKDGRKFVPGSILANLIADMPDLPDTVDIVGQM